MRLIKDEGHGKLSLVEHHDANIPCYVILSHTWGEDGDEVTYKDLVEGTGKNKAGYKKLEFCRNQAASDEIQYFWVDTCCIDKSSSAELSEAINSMFRWYQNAFKCYVYLSDVSISRHAMQVPLVPTTWKAALRGSRWFNRGWTLQELIAPATVEFFSREGDRLGSKASLEQHINEITGITIGALRGEPLADFEIEERFSWAKHRETKRQEDKAYSLLGIFNIHMSLRYGEGREEAFVRLQRKIDKSLKRKWDSYSETAPFTESLEGQSSKIRRAASEHDEKFHQEFFHAFSSRYSEDKDFNPPRVPGTCQWFLGDPKFRDWRDSESSRVLWISAGPGCGKSVLSKCLIDERLVSRRAIMSTVCYFFFKDSQEGRQSGADALTAILHQLYSSNLQSSLINHALDKYKKFKGLKGMFGELWKILMETAKDPAAGEIVCVIDALDECEKHARKLFLDELINFYSKLAVNSDAGIRLKFLITSRPYSSIQSRLDQLLNEVSYIHFDADENYDPISQDINKVIDYNLPRILGSNFDQGGQVEIATHLKATENRTYLWLSLVFDVMETKVATYRTRKKMRDLISELPSSVSAAYEQILNKSSDAQLARTIVQIILASRRPLTVSEMNVALEIATEDTCTSYSDLDLQSDDTFKSSLREICGLFVTVHDSQVYLIHQTAREFLLTSPEVSETDHISLSTGIPWEHTINIVDAETLMAKVCMSLIRFKDFSVLPKWGSDTSTGWYTWNSKYYHEVKLFVLLEYASHYWAPHYAAIQKAADPALLEQALILCDNEWIWFYTWYPIFCANHYNRVVFDQDKMTIFCELGLYVLVQKLLKESRSVDAGNAGFNTELSKASAGGHEKVVQVLLEAGADVNVQGGHYGNALQAASAGGHEKVVQVLLEAGADVNAQGGLYGNALKEASAGGHEKVVQVLLEAGADVNVQGGHYGNALQAASAGGHEKVVQMLLEAGADVNAQGGHYGNALQAASAGGHEKVVQMLLEAGADVNAQGGFYGNALQAASARGHEKVVQMLLEAGADVNAQGGFSGNALQAASAGGHEKVVQVLLEAGADVNTQGGHYGNALQAASARGHEKVVQMLLETRADVNAQGGFSGNALQAASAGGHEKVVQVLLEAGADVNTQGGHYGNALQAASAGGHEKVVQVLLEAGANIHFLERYSSKIQ